MRIRSTQIAGVALVELERREDDRGFFARSFSRQEFDDAGLESVVDQCNVAYNHHAGTVRGLHYQVDPAPEAKLVRCTRGAVLDVVVDMRPGSPTRLQHLAVELTPDDGTALYVPPFFAHGYQTLAEATEVLYQVSAPYTPGAERGLRFDDPILGLRWPLPVTAISPKDREWPLLDGSEQPER
jgi:dTDP-4-dehydrorhamnose 3,5-epimerase